MQNYDSKNCLATGLAGGCQNSLPANLKAGKIRYFWVVEARFTSGLAEIHADAPDSRTILAVSGGVDSVVMAHLFKATGRPFLIAHCNFQLRGDDSMADEQFVVALGEELGARVLVKRFATTAYATDQGVSVQMAARDLRYAWFKTLAKEHRAKIALAHHANDVVETMLFNLAKGTGLPGLHGINARDNLVIRPLLWATKAEILDYARRNKLVWREDVSNASEKYMRNLIRQQVVPQLERINPDLAAAGLRTANRVANAEAFVQYAINSLALADDRQGHLYIDKQKLAGLPGRETVLYYLLHDYGFNYDQVAAIFASLDRSGAVFVAREWQLNIDRDYLLLSRHQAAEMTAVIKQDDRNIAVPGGQSQMAIYEKQDYTITNDANIAALDLAKLSFPLYLRPWQQGDYFVPLGMQGKKKISDFLIDRKVPVNLKKEVLVLMSGDEIAWVVGHRLDNRYKITGSTRQVWQISFLRQV